MKIKERLKVYFESTSFQNLIVTLIIINSILIGMETSDVIVNSIGLYIDIFDLILLGLFTIEIMLKIYVYRLSFFQNPWNIFDFAIISISILPAAGSFSVFRALRIVRTLRLLKSIPKLRLIIESLIKSLPSIGWIIVLLGIVYYTFAIIGINMFKDLYPEYFGDLGKSFYTLFQVMTLESWSTAIARPIKDQIPFAGLYFMTFILIATYTTLNVFIAIVVNTMNEVSLKDLHEEEQHIKDFVVEENKKLHQKIDRLQESIQQLTGNEVTYSFKKDLVKKVI